MMHDLLIPNGTTAFPVLVKYSYYPTPYPLSASGEGNFGASQNGGGVLRMYLT
jgi:hypothetical protein